MILKEFELKELNSFVVNEMQFSATCAGVGLVVAAAVYLMSKMRIEVTSRMIYSLFRLFIVMAAVAAIATLRYVYYAIVSAKIAKGKMKVVRGNRPCFVKNCTRKSLQGKKFWVVKTFGFRYALRIEDSEV